MFNIFILLIKRIIFSMLLIYAYNSLAVCFSMIIPINISTVTLVSIFGVVAMVELIIFSFFC